MNKNSKSVSPSPSPSASPSSDADSNIVPLRMATGSNSLLGRRVSEKSKALNEKLTVTQTARQKLAEASDLINGSEAERSKGMALVADAGKLLYSGCQRGAIPRDEVTGILGDIFGWKAKGKDADKTVPVRGVGEHASKTPFGVGEHLRKRINRALDGYDYIHHNRETSFYAGLPVQDVASIVETVETEGGSLWTAYDNLAKLKSDNRDESLAFALNPAKIAGLVEDIRDPGFPAILASNEALQDAYAALVNMINAVDQEAAAIADAD